MQNKTNVMIIITLALAVTAGAVRLTPRNKGRANVTERADSIYTEIVAVAIVADFCDLCRSKEFKTDLQHLHKLLREQNVGKVVFIGVALDSSVQRGLRSLNAIAEFDEVIAGRGWSNTGLIRYVWNDLPGRAVVPQVVLTSREVIAGARTITFSKERLHRRLLGRDELRDFVRKSGRLRF
jgi:hypothetical protein